MTELRSRQQNILSLLGSDILIAPAEIPRSDVARFKQSSNFFYLTGFPEHGAVVVLDPTSDKQQVSLFVRENNEYEQIWDGFTIGVDKVKDLFPADYVGHINELESFLSDRLKNRRVQYMPVDGHPSSETIEKSLKDQNAETLKEGDFFEELKEMRLVKSPLEIEEMRKAIDITGEAFHACMRAGAKYRHEYQIEAEFQHTCMMQGAMHSAFGSIVAAGNHATCQHYVENSGPIDNSDLVLLDAGTVWNGYCADITRTFPVSGKFSEIQRDLYEVVLASQKTGVEMVAPGVHMLDLHKKSAAVLIDGLKSLGLLKGDTDELVEKSAHKDFWPGFLCHSLGLDVHDVTPKSYRKADSGKTLQPGMVITIEPGFYSQSFNKDIPEQYREIGIRIEDDILVTEDGNENLSIATVKEIADVEAMVQSGK